MTRCADKVAGNGDRLSPQIDIDHAAHIPEHDDESAGREQRVQQADDQVDRRVGRQAGVLGDTIFCVLALALDEACALVALLRKP